MSIGTNHYIHSIYPNDEPIDDHHMNNPHLHESVQADLGILTYPNGWPHIIRESWERNYDWPAGLLDIDLHWAFNASDDVIGIYYE